MSSSQRTACTGYRPRAVSPVSIRADAPSSTALYTSSTSARVGVGCSVMVCSSWVTTRKGFPARRHRGGDVLLGGGQVQKPQIAAQVPPGHGDHVAGVHPLGQTLPAPPVLDLGEYREVLQTPAGQGRPDLLQLMAAADKGLHHRRDPLSGGGVQVQQVLLRQGRAAQLHPGPG